MIHLGPARGVQAARWYQWLGSLPSLRRYFDSVPIRVKNYTLVTAIARVSRTVDHRLAILSQASCKPINDFL